MNPTARKVLMLTKGLIYYKNGRQYVPWVVSLKTGDSYECLFDAINISLNAVSTGTNTQIGAVVDRLVDLTKTKTLIVDWKNIGSVNAANYSYLVVSTVKKDSYGTQTTRAIVTSSFPRQQTTLDVSDLRGSYYIRVHARAGSDGIESRLKVYGVWGVK